MKDARPFVRAAKLQTMRKDINRLRRAIRAGDIAAADGELDKCERWFTQLLPVTDRDLIRPGGTTDPQGRRI